MDSIRVKHYRALPTDQDLAQVQKPVAVLYGADSPPFFGEAANWLSERLGTEPMTISGGHGPHYDRPEEVAMIIRDLAQQKIKGVLQSPPEQVMYEILLKTYAL